VELDNFPVSRAALTCHARGRIIKPLNRFIRHVKRSLQNIDRLTFTFFVPVSSSTAILLALLTVLRDFAVATLSPSPPVRRFIVPLPVCAWVKRSDCGRTNTQSEQGVPTSRRTFLYMLENRPAESPDGAKGRGRETSHALCDKETSTRRTCKYSFHI
jgi:hypothetical protein